MKFIQTLGVLFASMALAACSSLPDELAAEGQPVLSDFSQFAAQQGQTSEKVRLGGVIAAIDNYQDRTRLVVVNLPIGSSGKPNIKQEPNGRFFVYVDHFLEPLTYHPGRLITVIGDGAGIESGTIGEHQYSLPVIDATGYRLWRVEEKIRYDDTFSTYPCLSFHCRYRSWPQDGEVIKQVR